MQPVADEMREEGVDDEEGGEEEVGSVRAGRFEVGAEPGGHFREVVSLEEKKWGVGEKGIVGTER